jgi:small-conductance mechanosensitive channel
MIQSPSESLQDTVLARGVALVDRIDLPPALQFLEWVFLGNTLLQWGLAVLLFLLVVPLLRLVVGFLAGRLRKMSVHTRTRLDDLAGGLLGKTRGWVYVLLAFWVATLVLGGGWNARAATLARIGVLLQVGLWAADILTWYLESYRKKRVAADDAGAATAMGAMSFLGRLILWSVVLLTGLAMLGFEIAPALAGLGVGGIAVALAVQNILGDLFASLSIIFDQPFVIGDFIIVGDLPGTVEHVGLKTTRVRALSGEQLVFSNSDLLNSRIRNFKQMAERRILFRFGVQYDTGHDKLSRIPGIVQEIVEGVEQVRFDRAHFASFGDSSLDFEVVYFMLVPEFLAYMDAQQRINLELYRRMEELEVEFAFPTRTLHVNLDGAAAELRTRLVGAEPGGQEA